MLWCLKGKGQAYCAWPSWLRERIPCPWSIGQTFAIDCGLPEYKDMVKHAQNEQSEVTMLVIQRPLPLVSITECYNK